MATIPELLDGHVTLEVECLDRLYLNGYIGQHSRNFSEIWPRTAGEGTGFWSWPRMNMHWPPEADYVGGLNHFLYRVHPLIRLIERLTDLKRTASGKSRSRFRDAGRSGPDVAHPYDLTSFDSTQYISVLI